MDSTKGVHRRQFLGAAGGIVSLVIAGCTGDESPDMEDEQEPETTEPDSTPPAGPVTLRVTVLDETSDNPPGERLEVWMQGEGSWYPDLEFGSGLLENAGDFERYSTGELYVYPDGREDGVEIHVTMYFDASYISDSPRDMVRIEIHDDRVLVSGAPIDAEHGQFELEFER